MLKTWILEKIFDILESHKLKVRIDGGDIVLDSNRFRMFRGEMLQVNYVWKSDAEFLFKSPENTRMIHCGFSNKKFYCSLCIFDLARIMDNAYEMRKLKNWNDDDEDLLHFHIANRFLKQIQGNSREEIHLKLSLLGECWNEKEEKGRRMKSYICDRYEAGYVQDGAREWVETEVVRNVGYLSEIPRNKLKMA